MKPGLSKREKVLLFSLGLVALVYLSFQFVILPLATRYTEANGERERLTGEKFAHESAVATLPSLRDRNTEVHARFEQLTGGYPVLVENELIDNRMLTPLCINNNMSIVSLRFAPRPAPPAPVIMYDDEGNQIESEPPPPPVFAKVTVFINATGSHASLINLIDEVDSIEYIRLTNVSYSENSLDAAANMATISLTFEITFLSE